MKRFLFSLLGMMLVMCSANAQVLKGDMNGDGQLTVADITSLVNHILTNKREYDETGVAAANSDIETTWYVSKVDYTTFSQTENKTLFGGKNFKGYAYYPAIGTILIYGSDDSVEQTLIVKSKTATSMTLLLPGGTTKTYYTKCPPALVESIKLTSSKATVYPADEITITASALPTYADNKKVEWTVKLDAPVVKALVPIKSDGSSITLIASKLGGATIVATAKDGSGVMAYIHINVKDKPKYTPVDLGLSVKWCNMNVGAESPESYGYKFAWGETSPKDRYTQENYLFYDTLTDEYTDSSITDSELKLLPRYDAASVNMGGTWRMPTPAEIKELVSKCTWSLATQGGVSGMLVSGNGNSIFIPFESDAYAGLEFGLWAASKHVEYEVSAYQLSYRNGVFSQHLSWTYKYSGQRVRAVCP